jgi:hypothetical protein
MAAAAFSGNMLMFGKLAKFSMLRFRPGSERSWV